MDLSVNLSLGLDIPIPDLKLILHQPRLFEIGLIGGEENFFAAIQLLTVDKEKQVKDKSVLDQIDNFQIFMEIISIDKEKKLILFEVLKILFPAYAISLSPNGTALFFVNRENKENILVDKHNFSFLQNIIDLVFLTPLQLEEVTYNPATAKAREITEKIMKSREKIAKIKKATGENLLIGRYISILAIGLRMDCNVFYNYTFFQLLDTMKRFDLWEKNDYSLKIKLAGGSVQDSPEDNWKQNLYKK